VRYTRPMLEAWVAKQRAARGRADDAEHPHDDRGPTEEGQLDDTSDPPRRVDESAPGVDDTPVPLGLREKPGQRTDAHGAPTLRDQEPTKPETNARARPARPATASDFTSERMLRARPTPRVAAGAGCCPSSPGGWSTSARVRPRCASASSSGG
jgi:hypothetical protein